VVKHAALLLGLAACGPRVDGPSLAGAVAANGASAPIVSDVDRARACVVGGSGDAGAFASYTVFGTAGGSSPIAVVQSPAEIPLRFVAWPAAGSDGRARVELADNGLIRIGGFVDLKDRVFQLGARVDIEPPHAFAAVGTHVRVAGMRGGGLEITLPTPFDDPKEVTVTVPCRAVVYQRASLAISRRSRALPELVPKHDRLTFFSEPEGRAIFHAGVSPSQLRLSLLERRGAFAHVLAGAHPGPDAGGTLVIDAWVTVEDVLLVESSNDRDSGHHMLDKSDRCPSDPRMNADAPLRLGSPSGPVIGVAEKGADLKLVERRDGFVSIRFLDEAISPPPDSAFFVPMESVSGECDVPVAEDDEDGCACDTF
jgi:hypothetical protein